MRRSLLLAAALLALASSSCTCLEWLRQQHVDDNELDPSLELLGQAQPERLLNLAGRTDDPGPQAREEPLLVLAVSSELVANEVVDAVQTRPPLHAHGAPQPVYSLVLPPGEYELLAFADIDRDGFYEGTELVDAQAPG